MVKKHEFGVNIELCSKFMKKLKNKHSNRTWSAKVVT